MPKTKQTARKTTGSHLALSESDFAEHVSVGIGSIIDNIALHGWTSSIRSESDSSSSSSVQAKIQA